MKQYIPLLSDDQYAVNRPVISVMSKLVSCAPSIQLDHPNIIKLLSLFKQPSVRSARYNLHRNMETKNIPTHDAGKVGIFTIAFKVQKVKRSCSASPSTDDWITYKAPMMMSNNGKRFCHHPDLQNVFLWIRPIRKVHEQSMKSPEVD